MRKVVLGLVGVGALALASTANAAITIPAGPAGCDPQFELCQANNSAIQSTISFVDTVITPPGPTFSYYINFANDVAGNYWLSLESSTPDLLFTSLTVTPIVGSGSITYGGGPTHAITLLSGALGAGTYRLAFSGTAPNGGTDSGSLTFRLAVPEPGTWAMMLLGFAGIGMALRRRRRPALAQLA